MDSDDAGERDKAEAQSRACISLHWERATKMMPYCFVVVQKKSALWVVVEVWQFGALLALDSGLQHSPGKC